MGKHLQRVAAFVAFPFIMLTIIGVAILAFVGATFLGVTIVDRFLGVFEWLM